MEKNEELYETDCFYDPHERFENKIVVELEFVDCEPVPIKEFGHVFQIVSNLPRIGETVLTSRWRLKEKEHQYKIIDIKTYPYFNTHKIFYLKRLDVIEKENEPAQTIVQL